MALKRKIVLVCCDGREDKHFINQDLMTSYQTGSNLKPDSGLEMQFCPFFNIRAAENILAAAY